MIWDYSIHTSGGSIMKEGIERKKKIQASNVQNNILGWNREEEQANLSRRRMVESRQLARTQFSSYDKATLLTDCPKLSIISLHLKSDQWVGEHCQLYNNMNHVWTADLLQVQNRVQNSHY
jgi:hypothetical protein